VGLFPYLSIASIIAPVSTGLLSFLLTVSLVGASTASPVGIRCSPCWWSLVDSLAADLAVISSKCWARTLKTLGSEFTRNYGYFPTGLI
jgi:hypothetical protein